MPGKSNASSYENACFARENLGKYQSIKPRYWLVRRVVSARRSWNRPAGGFVLLLVGFGGGHVY